MNCVFAQPRKRFQILARHCRRREKKFSPSPTSRGCRKRRQEQASREHREYRRLLDGKQTAFASSSPLGQWFCELHAELSNAGTHAGVCTASIGSYIRRSRVTGDSFTAKTNARRESWLVRVDPNRASISPVLQQ